MTSPSSTAARDLSFITKIGRRTAAGNEHLGTGILVAERWVLTCLHVLNTKPLGPNGRRAPQRCDEIQLGELQVKIDGVWCQPGRFECHETADMALLELVEPVTTPPVTLFEAPGKAEKALWRDNFVRAYGYPGKKLGRSLEYHRSRVVFGGIDAATDRPTYFQMEGGIWEGCSGGPVVDHGAQGWIVIGMVYRGGEGVATSVALPSSTLLQFLREYSVEPRVTAGHRGQAVIELRPYSSSRLELYGEGLGSLILVEHLGDQREDEEAEQSNPYLGLRSFRARDHHSFFGRSGVVGDLWEGLRGQLDQPSEHGPLLLPIIGPSGVGKSSVVTAGLLPELVRNPLPGLEQLNALLFRPGEDPVAALSGALEELTGQEGSCSLEDWLSNKNPLSGYLERFPSIAERPLLLVVDQFEELFIQCRDQGRQQAFIDILMAPPDARGPRLILVFTLRSDFQLELEAFPEFQELVAKRLSELKPLQWGMSDAELKAAIEQPAEAGGRALDQDLVERLVRETRGRPEALPLLEFAAQRAWTDQSGRATKALIETNGIGGLLAERAEEIYLKLSTQDQTIARRVFTRAVLDSGAGLLTRRRVARDELVGHGKTTEELVPVMDAFARPADRLLTLTREPGPNGGVELAHEVLLQHWARLRKWLDEERDNGDRANRDTLLVASREWGDEEPGSQYWGADKLDAAADFLSRSEADLTADECSFIEASRKNRVEQEREREADAQRKVALEQQRARVRQALAVAAVVFLTTTGLSTYFWFRADQAQDETNAAYKEVSASLAVAKSNERRYLASEAKQAFDDGDWDLGTATVVAALPAAAGEPVPTVPAAVVTAMERAVYGDQRVALLPVDGELINLRAVPGFDAVAALSRGPNGQTILSFWRADAGAHLRSHSHPDWGDLRDLWLGPKGERLLGISKDDVVTLWSLQPQPTLLWSLSIGEDKWDVDQALSLLMTLGPDGAFKEWTLPVGTAPGQVTEPTSRKTNWSNLWLSPDGSHLAVHEKTGRLVLLQRNGVGGRKRVSRRSDAVESLVFSSTSPFPLVVHRVDGERQLLLLGSEAGSDRFFSLPSLSDSDLERVKRILWLAVDYRRMLVSWDDGQMSLLGPGSAEVKLERSQDGHPRAGVLEQAGRLAIASKRGVQLLSLDDSPEIRITEPAPAPAANAAAMFLNASMRLQNDALDRAVVHHDMHHGGAVVCERGTRQLQLQTASGELVVLSGAPDCGSVGGRKERFGSSVDYPRIRFSDDGWRLLIWSKTSPTLHLFDAGTGQRLGGVDGAGRIRWAVSDQHGTRAAIVSTVGELAFWDSRDGSSNRVGLATDRAQSIGMSPSGAYFAAAVDSPEHDNVHLRVWRSASRDQALCDLFERKRDFIAGRFDGEGRLLGATGDGLVVVWSVDENGCTERFRLDSGLLLVDAAWAPGTDRAVLLEDLGQVSLWDLATGRALTGARVELDKDRWVSASGADGVLMRDRERVVLWPSEPLSLDDLMEWARYRAFRGLKPVEQRQLFPPVGEGASGALVAGSAAASALTPRDAHCEQTPARSAGAGRQGRSTGVPAALAHWSVGAVKGDPGCHLALARFHEEPLDGGREPNWQRALFHYAVAQRLLTETPYADATKPAAAAMGETMTATMARRGAVARQLNRSDVLAVARAVRNWRVDDALPVQFSKGSDSP